jgi:hypothetical protein
MPKPHYHIFKVAFPVILCYSYFSSYYNSSKSRDSSVGYGLDDRGSRVRFPVGAGNFSLHHRVQNDTEAHPASYPMGTMTFFPGGKSGRGVKLTTHLLLVPRSKNAWSYTSTPPISLPGVVLSQAQGQLYLLPLPYYNSSTALQFVLL